MKQFLPSLQQRFSRNGFLSWDTRVLLRPAVILAVLVGSYILGQHATKMWIILIIGAIGVLILFRTPMLAIFPLILGTFLIKWEIGTGTQSSINVTIIMVAGILGLWVLEMLVQERRISLYRSRVMPPIIGLCTVVLLSFLIGQLPWFAFATPVSLSAQLGGVMLFLLSAGAFLWVANRVIDIKWLKWMVWLFLGLGTFYIVGSLLVGDRIGLIIVPGTTGSVLWIWMVAISSSQALLNKELKPGMRILIGLACGLTLLAGWLNRQWASGWVPAFVAFFAVISIINWRMGILIFGAMLVIFIIFDPNTITQLFVNDQYSIFTRQEAWKIVLAEIVKASPVLGLGPANYYNYTSLFPILGYSIRFNSHNQYVDLIAQIGIIGFAIFLWLVGEIFWLGWRLKDRVSSGFERAYVVGAIGALAGMLVSGMFGDWLIPFVYNIGLNGFRASIFGWLFLGGLVVIERLADQRI